MGWFKTTNGWPVVSIPIIILGIVLFLPGIPLANSAHQDKSTAWDIEALWETLLQRQPYPYTIPLYTKPSILDGIYTKKALKTNPIVPCRRCPDWVPDKGLWKLQLNNGVYRVIHLETGWKSIGTFIVTGNRMLLANDPCCTKSIGVYKWSENDGQLVLEVIDDPCNIKLRAKNLTETPWRSCQPPNEEAATTGHWPFPEGCR